jgi:hypothetical protein
MIIKTEIKQFNYNEYKDQSLHQTIAVGESFPQTDSIFISE